MPGTFTSYNKVRPGAYTNVVGLATADEQAGDRGIASLPLILKWGEEKTMITIEALSDFKDLLGYDSTDDEVLLAREAFKRASSLLVYRVNTGVKAAVTTGNLTATAKYTGTRGNDITIVITQNIDAVTFDVATQVDGVTEDLQEQLAVVADLEDNNWVDFTGTGALALTAGSPLVGGTDGSPIAGDYTDYLAALELVTFNTTGYPGTDSGIKTSFDTFINTYRDDQGFKVQAVLADYNGDYEGIINVTNGVILDDTTELTADQAVAWVTGATAAAEVNESLTFDSYDNAVDANPRRTNSDTITRLNNGEFMFTAKTVNGT
ncbi:MAG: phage tail sheath subtilisin-like domain-containing protein, partial [Sphaerochaetaceae bacterium]